MIKTKAKNIGGLLTDSKWRENGEMEKDGKVIQWPKRFMISVLPFEESRNILKYAVHPKHAERIEKQLADIHWGCLVELEIDGREVVNVNVINDVLADFYEENM